MLVAMRKGLMNAGGAVATRDSPIGEAQTNVDVNLNRLTEAVSAINDNRLLRAEAILIPISAILRRGCLDHALLSTFGKA